jgi:hypothetical protein
MRTLAALALVAALALPVRAEDAPPAAQWLIDHYKAYPIGGRWTVEDVTWDDWRVMVRIAVPPDQANRLMDYGPAGQNLLLGGQACPPKKTPVWERLAPRRDVYLVAVTEGRAFAEVSCSRHGL